ANAPRTPGNRAVLIAFGTQLVAKSIFHFRGKWTAAYTRAVSLGHADHSSNCVRWHTCTNYSSARCSAGRGNEGISAVVDVQHGALSTLEHHGFTISQGLVDKQGSVGNEGRDFLRGVSVFAVHAVRIERFRIEKRVRDHVLFADGILDGGAQQAGIQQVGDTEPTTSHLVFVSRPDAAGSGANLYASGSVFSAHLDHAVVGEDHVRAIGDKQVAVHLHSGSAQHGHFIEKCNRIKHHAIADDRAAAFAQNAARHKLEHKLFAFDDDRVSGIVAAGVPGHDREIF